MSMRDHYRTRAAEFHARARNEYDAKALHEYENLARQYSRLAEQAERNEFADLVYEPPPPKLGSVQIEIGRQDIDCWIFYPRGSLFCVALRQAATGVVADPSLHGN